MEDLKTLFRILHREQGQEKWEGFRDMEDRIYNIPRTKERRRDEYWLRIF